jgi:type I restriction enzyme M protein
MEACLLITRTNKEESKKGKILFINAVKEVRQEKTMAFLEPNHIQKIFTAYQNFTDIENFARLVDVEKVLSKNGNMAINLYVRPKNGDSDQVSFEETFAKWESSSEDLKKSMTQLFQILENRWM